jgi:hypothetical protein
VAAPPDAVIGSLSLMRFVGCRDNLLLAEMPGETPGEDADEDADEEQRL